MPEQFCNPVPWYKQSLSRPLGRRAFFRCPEGAGPFHPAAPEEFLRSAGTARVLCDLLSLAGDDQEVAQEQLDATFDLLANLELDEDFVEDQTFIKAFCEETAKCLWDADEDLEPQSRAALLRGLSHLRLSADAALVLLDENPRCRYNRALAVELIQTIEDYPSVNPTNVQRIQKVETTLRDFPEA